LRGIFDFLKNILLKPSRTYFHFYKKGFLDSHAVRIRVNYEYRGAMKISVADLNRKLLTGPGPGF
jgi:hypothetical protein